jgi:DNA polymerase I-like protein with 3'-5' exonuclease and polymerase domains
MRNDAIGLFWEDIPQARKGGGGSRIMPPIPDTGWVTPTELPDLSRCKAICIDTETYDPGLLTDGPGWARGKGHIVGISIAVPEGGKWYFPIRHEVETEYNLPPDKVLAWLKDTLGNPKQPKIGANLTYDIGWLRHEGVIVKGPLYDVQFAEALLREQSRLSLEILGQMYLGEGKESNELYVWCSKFYGGKANGSQRANIYRSPPRLVGHYAESDVDLPLRIISKQWPKLHEEGLFELFEMECRLIYLMIEMRFAGVSVDINKAEQLRDELAIKSNEVSARIRDLAGFEVNVDAQDSLGKAFNHLGIPTVKSSNGKPSFRKEWLEAHDHPLAQMIVDKRKIDKLKGTFVESYILGSHINGKIYGNFHQLNGEGGGTRSGRFSSSFPNLQNIPSRDEELAPLVRGIFIPDSDHKYWRKYDYSQIEYRFLIHFAVGPGSDEVRSAFNKDPTIDYHDIALDLVAPAALWDISTPEGKKKWRKPVKTINFGLIYGMGVAVLAKRLNISTKEARKLMDIYFKAVGFAKPTMEKYMQVAQDTGIIETILGRKSRFDLWEPAGFNEYGQAMPIEQAALYYRNIQRAYTHKALNRKLQGSSADLMKMAMLKCWDDGVFDATGVPRLTVHDELDFSDPGGCAEAFNEMQHIMQTAIPLRIPVLADGEIGFNWGNVCDLDKFDYRLGH